MTTLFDMSEEKLHKTSKETVEDYFERLQEDYKLKSSYQGIQKEGVVMALTKIGKGTSVLIDVVWCLLDNELPSTFTKKDSVKFSNGASIAHIGGYVGILMRKGRKLDREGRDYWIKPLRDIGVIEAVTFKRPDEFLIGHTTAKSMNSAYRLNSGFVEVLKAYGNADFESKLNTWIANDTSRKRLEVQVAAAEASMGKAGASSHKDLIALSISLYAKFFLPGYILVYKDDSDGDRVSKEERELMDKYGIKLGKEDAYPDAILFNPQLDSLYFIEAVTSDGEVDEHKIKGLAKICEKSNKKFAGSTTTYLTWKDFYVRQTANRNLANGSKVWIAEDPQKHMIIEHYS
ncbi:MAG: hypothetical protein EOO08_12180 [Chitinophagaceae bacterium]|nr:MAG: hypothetical protein EOO08_12180 [Chitinophagaceae bacterium]